VTAPALLEARGISVRYPGVLALDGVDFDVRAGEVHALIGENGAGKSTLVKVLTGELSDFGGELLMHGQPRRFHSPRDGLAAGIAPIPQELQLVTTLGADENIFLGRETRTRLGLVDRRTMTRRASEELAEVGESGIAPTTLVDRLEAAQRQLVAIARSLSQEARVLIMDEPTTSLGAAEVSRLEMLVKALAERGVAIVYISHQLDEVRRLAHRVTVLRDGKRVVTRAAEGLEEADMVRLMVGRQIERASLTPLASDAPEVLRVEGLSVEDAELPSGYRLHDVSLSVRRGEIVGLAGLVGAGRSDFLLALLGALDRPVSGRIQLVGEEYRPSTPAEARQRGLVLLPEERKTQAIFPDLPVRENITVGALGRVSRGGIIDAPAEQEATDALMHQTGVRAASGEMPIATLSGGNQQKAILARCLFASPSVLLLDEPTRGVDIAAKAEIAALLRRLASEGFGVVLCSSELPELLANCHRIVVFREGRVTAMWNHDEATEERVMEAATRGGEGAPSSKRAVSSEQEAETAGRSGTSRGGGGGPGGRLGGPSGWRRFTGLIGLAAVLLVAIVFSPTRGGRPLFLGIGNLTDILRQVAEKGILAIGMTAVIISGGIDLSVGSVLALAATLTAWLLMHGGLGLASTTLVVLAVGAAWGLVNGGVVARWRLQAFIVTLATMSAARGVARYLSGGSAIPLGFGPGGAPESVHVLAGAVVPYVPTPAVLFILTVLAMQLYLTRTRSGRYLYAIGDNETAARLSGVRVGWHKASVYVIAAVLAALAGVVHCAQLEQGNPNDGVAYELDAIAAVVIGGTSLRGGTGTALGTLVGVLIIGIINNIMGLNNVDANLQLILKGAIILGAVALGRR